MRTQGCADQFLYVRYRFYDTISIWFIENVLKNKQLSSMYIRIYVYIYTYTLSIFNFVLGKKEEKLAVKL